MDKIASYFEADDDDKDVLNDLSQARPCAVEHIICTKPSSTNRESAIKGVAFATNPLFGPSMLCLTADKRCTVLALLTVLKPVSAPLPLEEISSGQTSEESAMSRSLNSWDFEEHVRSILQRDYTQPLLRYDASMGDTLVDSEACRLITRVTQIIRNEYILKQTLANHAIMKRLDFLKQQEVKQRNDLRALLDSKFNLMDTAGDLAEKYEECCDRREILSKRLEVVMKHAQSKATVLSKAEEKMERDLKKMDDKMRYLKNRVEQVRAKYDYQVKESRPANALSSPTKAANPNLVQNFKDILSEEGQKIEDLVKKLNQMKVAIDS